LSRLTLNGALVECQLLDTSQRKTSASPPFVVIALVLAGGLLMAFAAAVLRWLHLLRRRWASTPPKTRHDNEVLSSIRALKWPCDGSLVELRAPKAANRGGYHVFLSHTWKYAQDLANTVKMLIERACPDCLVFLDVDDLQDLSELESLVQKSDCFLVILTEGYLSSRNCPRELVAAFATADAAERYVFVLRETDRDKGATSLVQLRAEVERLEVRVRVRSVRELPTQIHSLRVHTVASHRTMQPLMRLVDSVCSVCRGVRVVHRPHRWFRVSPPLHTRQLDGRLPKEEQRAAERLLALLEMGADESGPVPCVIEYHREKEFKEIAIRAMVANLVLAQRGGDDAGDDADVRPVEQLLQLSTVEAECAETSFTKQLSCQAQPRRCRFDSMPATMPEPSLRRRKLSGKADGATRRSTVQTGERARFSLAGMARAGQAASAFMPARVPTAPAKRWSKVFLPPLYHQLYLDQGGARHVSIFEHLQSFAFHVLVEPLPSSDAQIEVCRSTGLTQCTHTPIAFAVCSLRCVPANDALMTHSLRCR
jgi:hypothetical protein